MALLCLKESKPLVKTQYCTKSCLININMNIYQRLKCKVVPLQAWSGPEGSRKLRFPEFVTTAQDGCKFVKPYAPAAFTLKKYSWYSFLLEAASTPGPQCDRKYFISMKNSSDTSWDRTSEIHICSTAPQPLCYHGPLISVLSDKIKELHFATKSLRFHQIKIKLQSLVMLQGCIVICI